MEIHPIVLGMGLGAAALAGRWLLWIVAAPFQALRYLRREGVLEFGGAVVAWAASVAIVLAYIRLLTIQ